MTQSFPMNGGDGTHSYTNNSTMQRDYASAMKDAIKEAIIDNLDVKELLSGSSSSSSSSTIAIADLGCSVGPNTFYAVQTLIEGVQHKYHDQERLGSDNLELQVFFNDQIGNDFNTLFAALPGRRNYFAAGVAGSFYGRLFPRSSIHIAYSSFTIHWLSKVPEEVRVRDSPAWNAGRIHYTGASDAVAKAYADQFEEDMEVFLRARGEEISLGGMIVILMLGIPHRDVQHGACKMYAFIESILMDMVKEGVLEQEQVDSFNVPNYFPCIKDVRRVVDKNGCFKIVKMEEVEHKSTIMDAESLILHFRALSEGTIANHFGNEIVKQVFERAMKQKMEVTRILDSQRMGSTGLFFLVLKRKTPF